MIERPTINSEYTSENWPYKDFSYEEWVSNGMLLTEKFVPSKLDKKCYDLVRTTDFIEWFGDWQNSGDNSENNISKFVDQDSKEPMLFYRGDKSLFKDGFLTKKDEERDLDAYAVSKGMSVKQLAGSIREELAGARNQGVFFTPHKQVAISYGKDADAMFLGKYGMNNETDHPKSFPKLLSWLKSYAKNSNSFWHDIFDKLLQVNYINQPDIIFNNFNDMFQNVFSESERKIIWDAYQSRITNENSELIDLFVERGCFEFLINNFSNQSFADPNRQFGSTQTIASNKSKIMEYNKAPKWFVGFLKLREDYLREPLALSRVFIKSLNPKKGGPTLDSYEPYKARKNGHDSYIGVGHIGGMRDSNAVEVVVFDVQNIWVVDKTHLEGQ